MVRAKSALMRSRAFRSCPKNAAGSSAFGVALGLVLLPEDQAGVLPQDRVALDLREAATRAVMVIT